MSVNFAWTCVSRFALLTWEATMTEVEFYYLAMCIGAFLVFAITLAYSTWSWDRLRAATDVARGQASHSKFEAKSA